MLTINNTLDGYLKDVEIKGNTIQDAENLADIRSVGDKVEGQELYEIPVVSCGKNLFDKNKFQNLATDYEYTEASYLCKSIQLKPNTTYTVSATTSSNVGLMLINNKYSVNGDDYFDLRRESPRPKTYTTSSDGKLYIGLFGVENTLANLILNRIQIEEGTVATPYEPYQEDKLTILSPVQLEKVGDVADRIIEKDGVWGVEKNVATVVLNGSEDWAEHPISVHEITTRFGVIVDGSKNGQGISDLFKHKHNDDDDEHFKIGDTASKLFVYINKSRLAENSVFGFKTWLSSNNLALKYLTNNPTFIPLPHSQQVKLRTFANKTNISFGCEIEGTIKAQVPKSLGATVNTHTEQINNLNKELDRVKKLEESTVSTVETESDFTTVEATSNGYFEDVKLEGKTLVNLAKTLNLTHYTINNGGSFLNNEFNSVIDGSYSGFVQNDVSMYKPNTTYTAIVNVKSNTTSARIFSLNKLSSKLSVLSNSVLIAEPQQTGIYVFKFVTRESIDDSQKGFNVICNGAYTGQYTVKDVIILEGDHTQNPPSYFEGLKSAGQSATTSEDATDEIVVESVNENLISIEDIATPTNYISSNANYYIQPLFIGKGNTCYMNVELNGISTDSNVVFLLSNQRVTPYNSYKKIVYPNNTTLVISDSIKADDDGYVYLACHLLTNLEKATSFINKISLSCKDNKYTPHQSDKKRLLYYNNETQTWEKPILRQWDSIEKHSDGKYYYHQRSGEVVFNGTSGFGGYTERTNTIRVQLGIPLANNGVVNMICDKLHFKNIYSLDEKGIYASNKVVYLSIPKSELSSLDINGVNNWLTSNNVTVVYQLAQEKVYECTNIDLLTYANETNYIVECGAIVPKTTLKVHNNISNVVSLLQKKVSLLESNITSYMITQNRLMLASRYNADTVSFKVDVATLSNSFEYDNDLYELILNNILVGKDNYNREYIENLIIFYWMDFIISDEMYSTLFEIIEEQHNPKIEEEAPLI